MSSSFDITLCLLKPSNIKLRRGRLYSIRVSGDLAGGKCDAKKIKVEVGGEDQLMLKEYEIDGHA